MKLVKLNVLPLYTPDVIVFPFGLQLLPSYQVSQLYSHALAQLQEVV